MGSRPTEVCRATSRTARATQRNPALEKNKNKRKIVVVRFASSGDQVPTFRPLPCDSSGTEGTSGLTALGLKCLLPVAGSLSFKISHRGLNLWDLLTSPPWTAPPVPGKGGRAEIGPGTCLVAPALLSTAGASAKLQPPCSRCSGHPGRPRLGPASRGVRIVPTLG